MDFLARAGSMLDKAHRLAGFMLVLLVLSVTANLYFVKENSQLNKETRYMRSSMPVYVVPGSQTGMYAPTQDELLVKAFVDLVIQSLNTFTYETLPAQYEEARQFFAAEMLAYSRDYFQKLIRDVQTDRRSALFVPNKKTLRIEGKKVNGLDVRMISVQGSYQQILAGSVVETVPLEIQMELMKTAVSKTNPFGFMLMTYKTRQLGSE